MLEQVADALRARTERRPGGFTMARLVQRGVGGKAGAWGPVRMRAGAVRAPGHGQRQSPENSNRL